MTSVWDINFLVLEAEAQAEQARRLAQGEADAIFAKLSAQARGVEELLSKQAAGFAEIVKAAGGSEAAVQLMIADKLEELTRIQVEAVKNVKIDKVTVWDSGEGKDGKSATAGYISGLMKSIPPLNEMFRMAGMELPPFLGSEIKEAPAAQAEPAAQA